MKKFLVFIGVTSLTLSSISTSVTTINLVSINKLKDNVVNSKDKIVVAPMRDNLKNTSKNDLKLKKSSKFLTFFKNNKVLLSSIFNNQTLSNDETIKMLHLFLKNLSQSSLNIEKIIKYFSFYFKFSPALISLINELLISDQISRSSLVALQNFHDSSDIIQLKQKSSRNVWPRAKINLTKIAKNWNLEDFYQYQAGVNFNYMFKILSEKYYFGDLITKNIKKLKFDKKNFFNDVFSNLKILFTDKKAWPYLIKTIVPLLKTKILDCTVSDGFQNLTWEQHHKGDLSLKMILTKLKYLLSPEGKEDLITLITSLLTGPFSEDIIVNIPMFQNCSLSELFDSDRSPILNFFLKKHLNPNAIAKNIVDGLMKFTNNLNVIFDEIELLLNKDLKINLKELSSDLEVISSDDFNQSWKQIFAIIKNPHNFQDSLNQVKKILENWGIQKNNESNFKINSILFIIKKWLLKSQVILN